MSVNGAHAARASLPQGWAKTTLGEVCPPVQKIAREVAPKKPFSYIDIASIDNSSMRITQPKTFLGGKAPSRARQRITAGESRLPAPSAALKRSLELSGSWSPSTFPTFSVTWTPAASLIVK